MRHDTMKKLAQRWIGPAALAGLLLAFPLSGAASAAICDLALTANSATATFNGDTNFNSPASNAIDGVVPPLNPADRGFEDNAFWDDASSGTDGNPAFIDVQPPAEAGEMTLQGVPLWDRQDSSSPTRRAAPFDITARDSGGATLETFSPTTTNEKSYSFSSTTNTTQAASLRYDYTGSSTDGMFVAEIRATFEGDFHVGGFEMGHTNAA